MMMDQLTYIAEVKVGKVNGHSRVYPQLRLPSRYVGLVGKKGSAYEMRENKEGVTFLIRFES